MIRFINYSLLYAIIAVALVSAAPEAKKIELKLKLPAASFDGTPTNMRKVNLDPIYKDKKRGVFMVPEGTSLLSLNKKVTSSDTAPVVGALDLLTDGDKEAGEGSYMELCFGKQWVQIDLGSATEIYAIVLWHFHKKARVYRDTIVQVADDPDFIMNVRTLYNNDDDNSSGMGIGNAYEYVETADGKLIDSKGERSRYVRLYSNGNTENEMNHYIEVEVYGKSLK